MNTQKPNIKPGDILKLRNGTEVKILETDAPGDYPILSRSIEKLIDSNCVGVYQHTLSGVYILRWGQHPDDLILPKRRVPWNKLTDVELGHEYLYDDTSQFSVGKLTGISVGQSGVMVISTTQHSGWRIISEFKHRAPGTTEWLECDKEEEE